MIFKNGKMAVNLMRGATVVKKPKPNFPEVIQNNSFSIHGQTPENYEASQELIDKIARAAIASHPSVTNLSLIPKTSSGLPAEIPAGDSSIQFLLALSGFADSEPCFGDFVIRHNLDSNLYSVGAYAGMTPGASSTVDINGETYKRYEVTITSGTGNVWFELAGPDSAFPEDWDIQLLRVSDEAAFDNDSVPIWHATRFFIPEYLNTIQTWKPSHWRFMKSLRTEISDRNTLAEFDGMNMRRLTQTYPLEMCVGLCNYIRMGGWFNFPMNADSTLIDGWCDFIIENMDSDLEVIMGHGNEHWNWGGYPSVRAHYGSEAFERFGTTGAGVISVVESDRAIIRGAGAPDFTTIFGTGLSTLVSVGGNQYPIRSSTVTADSMRYENWWDARYAKDESDQPYYYNGGNLIWNDRGYLVKSTLAMDRVTRKFEAAGQMYRLTRMFEAQFVNVGTGSALNNASNYWNTPDYIDPKSVHDAVAINPYFGSSYLSSNSGDFKVALRGVATDSQETYNTYMRDHCFGDSVPGVTPSNFTLADEKVSLKAWRTFCDSNDLKLYGYEGGHHIIHDGPVDPDSDQNIIDAWRPWLRSPEAKEVYRAWADLQIPYLDGPVMKFQLFSKNTQFGVYGMFNGYTINEDSNMELAVLDSLRQTPAFYSDKNGPVTTPVENQSWQAGVDPNFSLFDYTSMNATHWSGTPPSGLTLNTRTGQISGTGHTADSETSYTFKAHNSVDSATLQFNITIT